MTQLKASFNNARMHVPRQTYMTMSKKNKILIRNRCLLKIKQFNIETLILKREIYNT